MKLMMRVQVVSAEDPRKHLPGLKVSLYDRDWKSEDDLLGTEVSDAKGEIFFEFDEKKYKDGEDGPDWRAESLPRSVCQYSRCAGQSRLFHPRCRRTRSLSQDSRRPDPRIHSQAAQPALILPTSR